MKKYLSALALLWVYILTNAQTPNADMELWDYQPVLLDWQTNSRPLTLPAYDPYVIKKDTDSYSGIWAANFYANGVFKPWATTTFPLSIHPKKLSLYYKLNFAPCVNDSGYPQKDTASVLVEILHNSAVVDQGYWESTSSNLSYSQLLIPVSQNAVVFDSCRITILGGKVYGGCGIIEAPTQFKIDHLELKYSNSANCIDSSQICDTCSCIAVYDPVCGCNGVTYTNMCEAYNAGVTSWAVGGCQVPRTCNADFGFYKNIDTVFFSNFSTGIIITGYHWDFGDGDTSNVEHPVHIYQQTGSYTVCLSVYATDTNGTPCFNSICDTIIITHDCIDSSLICYGNPLCCDLVPNEPVCGCDSVTYPNACDARNYHGVVYYYVGGCITGISETEGLINKLSLMPNPAIDKTELKFELSKAANVEINVVNVVGKRIMQMDLAQLNTGTHLIEITTTNLPKGVYLVQVNTNGHLATTRKLVVE